MSELYSQCPHCAGSRKLLEELHARGELLPAGSPCPFCGNGYNRVGMTERQLEALVEERDKLLELVAQLRAVAGFRLPDGLIREVSEALKGNGARVEDYRRRKGITGREPEPFESTKPQPAPVPATPARDSCPPPGNR